MSEDNDSKLITPDEIRTELGTVVNTNAEYSEYIAPTRSKNTTDTHIINVEDIHEGSETFELLSIIQDKISRSNNEVFSDEEKASLIRRLEAIGSKLKNENDYRDRYSKELKTHEETHRIHEVRLGMDKRKDELFSHLSPEVHTEAKEELEDATTTRVIMYMYDELGAIIGGLTNTRDLTAAEQSEFLTLAAMVNLSELLNDPDYFRSSTDKLYNAITGPSHVIAPHRSKLAYMMLVSGNLNLANDIREHRIGQSMFHDIARKTIRAVSLEPEKIIEMIRDNREFTLAVDQKLIQYRDRFSTQADSLEEIGKEELN